jgi:catechol 2,3-dioxygenase-like lactoylglutathione lyase family enzyme
MSTTEIRSDVAERGAGAQTFDMKLEVLTIPVSDVERARAFYVGLGWRQDVTPPGSGIVQLTPPGSSCSVQFGINRTSAKPGSSQNQFLIVSDIEAAREELMRRGARVSEIFHVGPNGPESGPAPGHASYGSLATFSDPDDNVWLLQEVTRRLPGRVDSSETSYASVSDLAAAMKRAEAAHGEHEKRTGMRDEEWPTWYATYMASEQSGAEPPQ